MADTVRTPNTLLTTLFQDGQAPGSITPQDARDLIVTMASLGINAQTPQMYGAKADGSDDTAALQAWATAIAAAKVPGYVPAGTYSTTGFTITSNVSNTEQSGPPLILGAGEAASIFQARSGATSPLIKWQNVDQVMMQNIGIDCNGLINTGLDTSWNVNFGPSLENVYKHIEIRNFISSTVGGWVAQANNDCFFENVIMDSPSFPSAMALQIDGHGGALIMTNCFFGRTIGYSAQKLELTNCITSGFRVIAGDFNQLLLFGGYHYGDNGSHIMLDVPTTMAATFVGFGARMENNTNGGKFIGSTGGGGTLRQANFYACRFLNTTAGGTGVPILLDSTLVASAPSGAFGPELGMCRVMDSLFALNISTTAPAAFCVSLIGCYDDNTGEIVGPETWRVGRAAYSDHTPTGLKCVDNSWGTTGSVFNAIVAASSGTPGVVTGIPSVGMAIVARAQNSAPLTQFRYCTTTKDTAFSVNDGSGHSVAAAISFGTNWQITVTPSFGTSQQYAVTIFGQQ